jgi:ubiquinone/menaquinone biosynthesis C-methylase UbiE
VNDNHQQFCASPAWRQMVEEQIMPLALDGVDLGDDVLEVGPGPGFTTDVLRTRTKKLTAVEIDPDLAAALADRLAGSNVEVVVGDATALDLPSARFTGAASFHMIHHVGPPEAQRQAFSELARVVESGGVLVVADASYSEGSHAFHHSDTYQPMDPETLKALLSDVGFCGIKVKEHELGWVARARAV